MKGLRIVPDTNILVSALILNRGNPRDIFNKFVNGEIIFILSEELLAEFLDVLSRPKFNNIFEQEKIDFINLIKEFSEIIIPLEKLDIIKEDSEDNKILEVAIAGKAHYIISGDEHLLKLKEFRGIRIVNAQEFLNIINQV